MSHYIHAGYPTGESELNVGGYNLNACSRTGFDFYSAYNASQYDRFWSGAGGVVTVSHREARRAFLHALAWAFALLVYCKKLKETGAEPDAGVLGTGPAPPSGDDGRLIAWAQAVADSHMEERRLGKVPLTATAPPTKPDLLPKPGIEDHIKAVESAILPGVSDKDQWTARKLSNRVLKLLEKAPPNADDLERSTERTEMFVQFTWEVYHGTKTGPATMAFG